MVTLPQIEDDDLETETDKCFACEDFGKTGALLYRCTGCEFGCVRSAVVGNSLMVIGVTFALDSSASLNLLY
jgi:hypothetical protein